MTIHKLPFREYHLLAILQLHDHSPLPLDLLISTYFRSHSALGSKDRAYIADTIYSLVRWKGLLDAHLSHPNWQERLALYQTQSLSVLQSKPNLSDAEKWSFPEELFQLLIRDYGQEKASSIASTSNTTAPATVRVNTLKISRDTLFTKWESLYRVALCPVAKNGIVFTEKTHFFSMPDFVAGYFEVQDEGSQILADLMDPKPGEWALDYCAGSGGKTLAFASKMEGKGQIFLHDVRKIALSQAKKRLKRAGIQNAQFHLPESEGLKKLKKKVDWVLVDAPCSGTGTLRRNPDMKWKFQKKQLLSIVQEQRHIFEKALQFVKPGGRIVYATCSVLSEENEEQVAYFLKTYSLEIEKVLKLELTLGGMDGFFGVVFKKI